ncbi:MAG: IgGFc-binding protein, partial [Bacteroidota bacterium]
MKIFKRLVFLIAIALAFNQAYSQFTTDEEIKESLPKMLGANNVGKEFWFTIPICFEDESFGFANFIKIFVTSPYRTRVTVEVPGKSYFSSKMSIPNDVISFDITPTQGQPYVKGGRDPEVPDQVWIGAGIHIYADDPIVVYCIVRYHWTSDGFLAIPVSSLGKEYIVAGHPVDPMFRATWNYKLPNTCGIVAAYDQTKVRFTLGGNSLTKTAGGLRPGQTVEKILNKGDVFMVSTEGDASDLTGSRVVATKPVAVVTGNMCNNIPVGNQWCDYTVEMDLPTFTWGTDYHIPDVGIIPKRAFPSLLRIFAKEKNTTLYRDGREFAYLKGLNGMEGNGWLETRMNPQMVKFQHYPVVISGDKPIGVTLYNPGVQEDQYAGNYVNSDPFVMVITPLQQYQKEITFCTPCTFGGDCFSENYLGIVYQTNELGMCPDDLEFAEVKSGQFVWKKVNVKFPGVDPLYGYDVNGKKYAYKVVSLPQSGVFKLRSKTPFAAYSYGFSDYDSYGYPTSAALADLEKPDTLPPDPKWRDSCGVISFATVTDMPDDPT